MKVTMQSNQHRAEEVSFDKIVEKELQPPKPPKRKKKKVSFAVWWELYAPEELKVSAENIEQQDASLMVKNESIAKSQETVDHKGDRPTPENDSNVNQVPFQTRSEEHVPVDEEISARSIEKQHDSLISEESIAREEETIDISEKEQPTKTRRKKKKKIPFHIWLEKQAPADLSISTESTGPQDTTIVTKEESISVLQETPEKEESFKSCTENVDKQDSSLPGEGDQEESLKKEICPEEPSLIIEQDFISKTQETLDQQEEEQPPKTRRIKKKKIPFHVWLEKHAPADLRISDESTGPQDTTIVNKEESIPVLQETPEKEESFDSCAENVNKQESSLPGEGDQTESLEKEIFPEGPLISTTQLVTKKKSISKSEKKVDQKGEKHSSKNKRIKKTPLLWKSFPEPDACVDLTFLTQNSDINNNPLLENPSYQADLPSRRKKTFWKVFPESESHIDLNFFAEHIEEQDVSVPAKDGQQVASLEKQCYSKHTLISTTSQVNCTCQAKSKEPELGNIELQKYLMRQLDEMFDINRKLSAKLKYQNDLLRKVLSEQRQNRKSTGWGHEWVE